MYFPIRRSLPARPEPENTFWTANTVKIKGRVTFMHEMALIKGENDV